MHLTNLLTLTTLSLTPTLITAYGIAHVSMTYHEACPNNAPATGRTFVGEGGSTGAVKDACTHISAKHSMEIDAYSFAVSPLTDDTTEECHAVAFYSDHDCLGSPVMVVPLSHDEDEVVVSPCIKDGIFDEKVSVRLICEHGHGHGRGRKHGPSEHDDDDDEEEVSHGPMESFGGKRYEKRQDVGGLLGGLGGLGGLGL